MRGLRKLLAVILILATAVGFMVWSPVQTPALAFGLRAAFVDRDPSPALAPGATTKYSLHFRNVGLVAWQRGTDKQVNLGVVGDVDKYADASTGIATGWISPSRIATTTEQLVLPGGVGTFTFNVRAPGAPGTYKVPVRLVVDGIAWLDHEPVTIEVTSDLGLHGQLVEHSGHLTLRPGELSPFLTARFRNTGAKPWVRGVAGQQLNLGIAGDDKTLSAFGVGWPAADRVAVQTEPSVGPGATATFTFRVRAPSVPGTYALRLRPVVDGVAWLEDEGLVTLIRVVTSAAAADAVDQPIATADKVSLGLPSFTFNASVSPGSAAAGSPITITANLTAVTPGTAMIGIEVSAPGGASIVYQKWFHNESFGKGEQRGYPVTWTIPRDAAPGAYSVKVSAYSEGWKTLYDARQSAATLAVTASPQPAPAPASTVSPSGAPTPTGAATAPPSGGASATPTPAVSAPPPSPSFTSTASVAPTSVVAGAPVNMTAVVTSATATNALVDIEIWAAGATAAAYQVWFDNQSFTAGQQHTYPATWQVPTNAATGAYSVRLAVYAPAWATLYSSVSSAAVFSVALPPTPSPTPLPTPTPGPTTTASPTPTPTASPATPTPTPSPTASPTPTPVASFTVSGAAAPSSLPAGSTVTLSTTVTSNQAITVLVGLGVYSPTGVQLFAQGFDNQILSAGVARTFSINYTVPAASAAGAYTLRVGVYTPGWVTLLLWTDPAATFSVTAPTSTPTPTPPPPPPPGAASPLHVQGNLLKNAVGQTVTLHGVNRGDSPAACNAGYGVFEGGTDQASVQAMKNWRINAVRISLNEDCWLGINGVPAATSGANFQQAVRNYVALLNQNGIYAILDLHWNAAGTTRSTGQVPMPDLDHAPTFWSQVANAYKGNDSVILELFNEPWPNNQALNAAAWTCWRDGSAGGTCTGFSYSAVGMQSLLNTVRATGATNVVALGGVAYSNGVGSWLAYRPSDSLNNVVAAWHVYNFNSCSSVACFDSTVAPVGAQVPVIATEIGVDNCDAAFLNALMAWLDVHGLSYTAWTWNLWGGACSSFALVSDWAGTPTTYGQTYRTHLAALP